MNCPYCDALMKEVKGKFICPGGGRLLTKESGPCPYKDESLTMDKIGRIATVLLDIDTGD